MNDKLKVTSENCPKGDFLFCAVVGQGVKNSKASTRKKDVYEYTVTLELDEKDAANFMDEVDDFIDDNAVKGCELGSIPYQTREDYDGIPEGKVWIKAKCKTTYEDQKTGDELDAKINIYDAGGDKCILPEGVGIGKGSTGKIMGSIAIWDRDDEYGATFWLSGVQLADFTPYTFDEQPEAMEGSFKGFTTPQLEKDEAKGEEESPRRSRRDRNKSTEEDDDKPSRPRRSRR